MEINMSDKEAETQLLELVRGQDSKGFTLTISSDGGRWTVTTTDLDADAKAVGEGDSFAEAWHCQKPTWAR